MALLTQYATFFISPFGEKSVTDELNSFLRSHRIINFEKKLLDGERGTGWAFLVEYAYTDNNRNSSGSNSPRVDYREVLTPVEFALFEKLRELRKGISEKSGIPVYAVFTNEQIAAMVKKTPVTPRDLMGIPGIGESRIKQYGQAFINVIAAEIQTEQSDETPELPL